MSNGQELVLHKKSFQQLTTDELYELLRVRSEVFVVEQRSSSARFALRRTASIRTWTAMTRRPSICG